MSFGKRAVSSTNMNRLLAVSTPFILLMYTNRRTGPTQTTFAGLSLWLFVRWRESFHFKFSLELDFRGWFSIWEKIWEPFQSLPFDWQDFGLQVFPKEFLHRLNQKLWRDLWTTNHRLLASNSSMHWFKSQSRQVLVIYFLPKPYCLLQIRWLFSI